MTFDTHTPSETETAVSAPRPRIRFGTIVWGFLVFGAGTALLSILGAPGQRNQVANWALSLTPSDSILITTIVVGAAVLILGLLAVVRSQQKQPPRE
jgi:multisubunit Na+/H+ antiporter MnhC subunit